MMKLRFSYSGDTEKDKLINTLRGVFNVTKVSKPYVSKEGSLKRVYIDLREK